MVLLGVVALLIYVPPVQQFIRGKAVQFLKEKTGTEVRLDHLALRFPIGLRLNGLYVEDQQGDTLLFAGTLKARLGLTALLDERIVLGGVELSDVRASVFQRADSTFNFDFIIDGLSGTDSTSAPVDTSGSWDFSIEDVALKNIRLDVHLAPSSLDLDLQLGELELDFDRFQLDPRTFHVDDLALRDTRVSMRTKSSPPEPDTYPALINPLADLDIRFEQLDLERVSFFMKTTNTGDSLWLDLPSAKVSARSMDLTKQEVLLDELELNGCRFGMLSAAAGTKEELSQPTWLDENDGFRFFIRDWSIGANAVLIGESSLQLHTGSVSAPDSLLDMGHIMVHPIDLDIRDLVANNGAVAGSIREMKLALAPDSLVIDLAATLNATPARLSLQDGSLHIDGTKLQFNARADQGSLAAFYRAPYTIPLHLSATTALDLQRLRHLTDQFGVALPMFNSTETWSMAITVAGTVDELDSLTVDLEGDQGTVLIARARLTEMRAWPRSAFLIDVDRMVMGKGLRDVLVTYAPPNVIPQAMTLELHGLGNEGRITADLDMHSDLGDVSGSVIAAGMDSIMPDAFTATIITDRLLLARITGDTGLGPLSVRIEAHGDHMNSKVRTASATITTNAMRYKGFDLSTMQLVADLEGDSVHTNLSVADEPLQMELSLKGVLPNGSDSLRGHLDMQVKKLDFEKLGLLSYPLSMEGNWQGDAAFSTDGHGSVDLAATGLRLANASRDFVFEHFRLGGYLGTDSTAVDLDSDALTVRYNTNLPVDSLVPQAQAKLLSFFRSDSTFVPTPGKRMELDVTLPRTEWITGLVVPQLESIQLERFNGRYDSDSDVLDLDIIVPYLNYDSIRVTDVGITVHAERQSLTGAFKAAKLERDPYFIEGLTMDAVTQERALITTLTVLRDGAEHYRIGAELANEVDARTFHLLDDPILDGRNWTVDPQNLIRFKDGSMQADRFKIGAAEEQLELITDAAHARIKLTRFQLSSLTHIVSSADSVQLVTGVADGTVDIPQRNGSLAADLTLSDLKLIGTEIGDLHLALTQPSANTYHAKAILDHANNNFDATADITTGSSVDIDANAKLDFENIGFLKPFVDDFLYDLGGAARGDIGYHRTRDRTAMDGQLTFDQAAIGVIMTGATYTLPKATINFDPSGAHFKEFELVDSLGNIFRLDGEVGLMDLTEPTLDLRLRTNEFRVLNSTLKQNDLFYGKLLASIDLGITGTTMNPAVKGSVGVLPGTEFSVVLPGSKVELVEAQGVVIFADDLRHTDSIAVATDSEMLRDSIIAQLPGVELDLKISVDKAAAFAIVLDPTTGDEATFSGSGDLVFRYKPDGEMYLSGPFTLDKGEYTLEFYGLVKKRFELVQGSSITWNGDPIKAAMDIKARYTSKSAPYPLVASSGNSVADTERNRLQQPLPFQVIIAVDGSVNDPKIDFGIDLDRDLRNSYPQVSSRLDQLAQTGQVDERNKQVFGLLVLNSFIQDEASGGAPSSGIASSAARNSVNGLLTDQMNKLTGKFVKGVDISLGVNTYDQASGNQTYQRTSVDYKVSKRLLNDRLSFEVGGSVGVDEQNSQVSNVSNTRAAQYAILYDLTKDGRFRLRGFHENAYDLYDGEITNSGIALMFTKDFEENERARAKSRMDVKKRQEEEEQNRTSP